MESRGQLGTNSLSQQSPPLGAVQLLASSCVPCVLENFDGTTARTVVQNGRAGRSAGARSCRTVAPLYEMSHC